MNFYTVMQHREQIGEDRVEAGNPVGVISVIQGRNAGGGLVVFRLIHASQGNKLVDENRSPLYL